MSRYIKHLSFFQKLQAGCCIVGFVLIIAAILFPVMAQSHIRGGPRTSCISRLKNVGTGIISYVQDYDGQFPGGGQTIALPDGRPVPTSALIAEDRKRDWITQLIPYTKNPSLFYCPSDPPEDGCERGFPSGQPPKCASSYTMNGWTAFGFNNSAIKNHTNFVLVAERNAKNKPENAPYLFSWWEWQRTGDNFTWPPVPLPVPTEAASTDLAITRHSGLSNYIFADGHVKAYRFARVWSAAAPNAFWPESK